MRRLAALLFVTTVLAGNSTTIVHRHGASPDVTAPEAISDLTDSTPTASSCLLSWTAPHEDGGAGGAVTSYDCRRRVGSTFVEGDWAGAALLSGEPVTPGTPGASESFTASGLSASTQYAFACKSTDDAANISAISNATDCTTSASTTFSDGFTSLASFNQDVGAWAIVSNELDSDEATNCPGGTCINTYLRYTATQTSNANMFACIEFVDEPLKGGVVLRMSGATGSAYDIHTSGDTDTYWLYSTGNPRTEPSGTPEIDNCGNHEGALTFANTNYLCADVNDTGNNTVVRVWKFTSAPGARNTWGTANCTMTADPPTAVDSGTYAGVYWFGDSSSARMDNFSGGDY